MDGRVWVLVAGVVLGTVAFPGAGGAQAGARAGTQAGPNPDAPPETGQMGFLIGTWDLVTTTRMPDGTVRTGSATLEASWILDGYGVLVEEHHQASGFRSLQVFHFDTDAGQWAGAAVNTLGNRKILDGAWEDGELVLLLGGELFGGRDGVRRLTFHGIRDDGFRLRNDYSPDGGATWELDTYSYVATRRPTAGPGGDPVAAPS